jgi:hypothetical protein
MKNFVNAILFAIAVIALASCQSGTKSSKADSAVTAGVDTNTSNRVDTLPAMIDTTINDTTK